MDEPHVAAPFHLAAPQTGHRPTLTAASPRQASFPDQPFDTNHKTPTSSAATVATASEGLGEPLPPVECTCTPDISRHTELC